MFGHPKPTLVSVSMLTRPPSAAAQPRPWLEAVAQISRAVNSREPLEAVLDAVAETTCRLLAYDFSAVLLADDTKQRLLIRGSHGLSSAYVASVNNEKPIRLGHGPYGEGPSSRAFRSLQPVVVDDYQRDPAVGPWAGVASEQGLRSLAVVPVVVSGVAIGTLNCYTSAVHDFGDDEILLIGTMANEAASAIEAARLREQEQATIARLEEARESLETQTRILERSEAIHAELTGAVLADAGLETIATTLARILAGPVIIDDPAMAILAKADGDGSGPDGETLARIREDTADKVAELVAARQPRLVMSTSRPGSGTVFVTPVTIGREVVARLWVAQPGHELGGLERRAMEHGATVIALELLKQRIAYEVESRLRGELLDDLLDGRLADQRAIEARANHLDYGLDGRHSAAVISLDLDRPEVDAGRARQLYPIVSATLRRNRLNALAGERDGAVVVLLGESPSGSQRSELGDAIRSEVRRVLGDMPVLVALGPWVDHIADIGRSYAVARGASRIARNVGGRDRTITLDDLGVYGLLLTVDRLDNLQEFAAATLRPIREYDERKVGELLPTLRSYLRHACRTAEAAAELVVHPNTVAYRIRRIESLLGLDLGQPQSLLQVQLALIVDEIVATKREIDDGRG